jgi:hypothetical protein
VKVEQEKRHSSAALIKNSSVLTMEERHQVISVVAMETSIIITIIMGILKYSIERIKTVIQ